MNLFALPPEELEAMVMSASPSRLIVLTYDGAIQSLELAIEMIGKGDIEGRWRAVEKATNMITELYMALDHEKGGEIAQNLGCLYGFCLSRLPRINFYNDKNTASDVIGILQRLRDSWDELDHQITMNPQAIMPMESAAASASF